MHALFYPNTILYKQKTRLHPFLIKRKINNANNLRILAGIIPHCLSIYKLLRFKFMGKNLTQKLLGERTEVHKLLQLEGKKKKKEKKLWDWGRKSSRKKFYRNFLLKNRSNKII